MVPKREGEKLARHRGPTAHARARYRCFLPDLAGLAGKRRAGPMPDFFILALPMLRDGWPRTTLVFRTLSAKAPSQRPQAESPKPKAQSRKPKLEASSYLPYPLPLPEKPEQYR